MSSLMYTPAFSVAHANILAATSIKLTPTLSVLWRYVDLLDAEFNDRALEEHEYSKQKPQDMVVNNGMVLKLMVLRRGKMAMVMVKTRVKMRGE
eukprot:184054-Amphidinium_carterae.2